MAKEMTARELEALKFFLGAHKHNWDLNQYYRAWYDEDLEMYRGYRNEQNYPLAYKLSFNKLLPRVMTTLGRFMDQLYQAGTGDFVSVRPRKRSDVDRAPRVQGLLNQQLESLNEIDEQGGSYLFNFTWMFNAVVFGKGIAKVYWRKEERIAPRRINFNVPIFENGQLVGFQPKHIVVQEPQLAYNAPYAEIIHNKLFNPHPHYRSIQKMPFVSLIYTRSLDYIKRQADKGVFKNIDKLGWSGTQSSTAYSMDSAEAFAKSLEIEGASEAELETMVNDRRTPQIDIIEGYGKYIWPEDDAPYEVGSGYKIKGMESETIVHIGNYKTILRMRKNPYETRPLFDIGCYYHPELYWDLSIIRLGKSLQEQYDSMSNLRHENAMMLMNNMLKVRFDADIDPAALTYKPFGIIPVEDMDDVHPLEVNDMFQSGVFREQEQFFDEAISDITGLYPYNLGQTPPRQEHVGTIYSLQSMGEARTRLLMMTMDHQGFRPFLKYMMLLNQWHLPTEVETRINSNEGDMFIPLFPGDIHIDYDFSARYTAMEPALGKQFRANQLIQYANLWQQSPYLQQYQFMKAVLELMDFHDSDKYLKTPQQVAQEMMQQVQMQTQLQMQQASMQDMLSANQSDREMKRDVVKGLLR